MAHGGTILYVEDDAVTLTAYKRRLERIGFKVESAQDGLEAARFLHHSEPSLILLDLMLPRFNGEDVLKYIYADSRLSQIPVIILSTNTIVDIANDDLVKKAGKRLLKETCTFETLLQAINEQLALAATAPNTGQPEHKLAASPANRAGILSQLQLNRREVQLSDGSRLASDGAVSNA